MMYLKFIFRQLKVLGMVVLGFFIFPFVLYPKRRKIWEMKNLLRKKWYFWFADTSEKDFDTPEKNYLNSIYGLYELVQIWSEQQQKFIADYEKFKTFGKLRKFFLSYHWMVFRNGAWNYIAKNKPIDGDRYAIRKIKHEGDAPIWQLRDKKVFGKQFVIWKVDGIKLFRYSFTKKVIGKIYLNVQLGAGYDRWIVKAKLFKNG